MLFGAGVGFIFGLVPLVLGVVKKNLKYGVAGFVLSIISGGLVWSLLAIAISVVFSWLVVSKNKSVEVVAADGATTAISAENAENL